MKLDDIKNIKDKLETDIVPFDNLAENLALTEKIIKNKIEVVSWCSKCIDGYIREKKKQNFGWNVRVCDCYKKIEHIKQFKNILKKSGIYENVFNNYKLKDYSVEKRKEFLEVINNALQKGERWFYFFGSVGTWKTFTAIIIAKLAMELELGVFFMSVPRLLDYLRPSEEDLGRIYMEKCIQTEVLILDDIGQEKSSAWVLERLYVIINERYMNWKITVFTSNKDIDNLELSSAIKSRLSEKCITRHFYWRDKRIK